MSPGLLMDSNRLFGTRDLYAVLSVSKSASKSEVKRAYYALSLVIHPDRVEKEDRLTATQKFQVLGKVYSILSDDERRAYYDETGSVDEESCADTDRDWSDYWRLIFPRINVTNIDEFQAEYQYSEEERNDLMKAYLDHNGDMDHILDSIMCSTIQDEPRFREILEGMIESGDVPSFDSFTNEKPTKSAARKRKADKEKKESDHVREKRKAADADTTSLEAMILSRQKSRDTQADDFFSHLEQKYGAEEKKQSPRKPSGSGAGKKKDTASPTRRSSRK